MGRINVTSPIFAGSDVQPFANTSPHDEPAGRPPDVVVFQGVPHGDWCDRFAQHVQLTKVWQFSGSQLRILAEGAIALPVTLSGGALFASTWSRMVEKVDEAKLITLPYLAFAMSGPQLESFPSSIIALCFIGA